MLSNTCLHLSHSTIENAKADQCDTSLCLDWALLNAISNWHAERWFEWRQVTALFNCHRHTITRVLHHNQQYGGVVDRPRTGCPRATTQRQDEWIQQHHLENRFHTAVDTATIRMIRRHQGVHPSIGMRRLDEVGLHPEIRPILNNQHHCQARVQWCRTHNWLPYFGETQRLGNHE